MPRRPRCNSKWNQVRILDETGRPEVTFELDNLGRLLNKPRQGERLSFETKREILRIDHSSETKKQLPVPVFDVHSHEENGDVEVESFTSVFGDFEWDEPNRDVFADVVFEEGEFQLGFAVDEKSLDEGLSPFAVLVDLAE